MSMSNLTLLAFFVLAAATDWVSVKWHGAREQKRAWRTAILSMVIEGMNWLPVWTAIQMDDWRIMVVSVLGSGVGTRLALKDKDGNETKEETSSESVQDPRQVLP